MPTPTRQLLASTFHLTDGTTTIWNFSFSGGYIDKGHIKAYYETPAGIRTIITVTEAMVVGAYQLQITPVIASGNTLVIYRDTPKTSPLVDFTDESGLSEIALDTTAKQAVFIGAEAFDNSSATIEAQQAASDAEASSVQAGNYATAAALSADTATTAVYNALTVYTGITAIEAARANAEASATSSSFSAAAAASSAADAAGVFTSNTTTFTRTVLDDTDATSARVTLGAASRGANTDITSILGNAATATTASVCTGNSASATTSASCSGNSATASVASSCSGNAATATTDNQHLGVGQTWQGVARSSGVTYTNSTGKPIVLKVDASTNSTLYVAISINGVSIGQLFAQVVPAATPTDSGQIIIPTGATYMFTITGVGAALVGVYELR